MSADRLREAAEVLRVRAESAYTPEALTPYSDPRLDPQPRETWPDQARNYLGGEWGDYVATVHPGVGLGIARLLDHAALYVDERNPLANEAASIADAILGGAS